MITPYKAFRSLLFDKERNRLSELGSLIAAEAIILELNLEQHCKELYDYLQQNREDRLRAKARAKEIRLEIPKEYNRILNLTGTNHFLFGDIPACTLTIDEYFNKYMFDERIGRLTNYGIWMAAIAFVLDISIEEKSLLLATHLKECDDDFNRATYLSYEIKIIHPILEQIEEARNSNDYFWGFIPGPLRATSLYDFSDPPKSKWVNNLFLLHFEPS